MVELTNKIVKCRVKHRCIWCGEFIYPMQKAVYRSGVYEGNFFSDHWHEECFEVAPAGEEFEPEETARGKNEIK